MATLNAQDEYIKTALRLPRDLHASVQEAAERAGRSMNAEIIQRLDHSFTPWEERPWEERMVTDIGRAMLKLLTKEEYGILLDRVKAAGGADAVNGYRPTFVGSSADLQPAIPDGPRLQEMIDNLPAPTSEADAIATQLAVAVLRLTGKLPDEQASRRPVLVQTSRDAILKPLESLEGIVDNVGKSRTPKIPGQNAPKRGLGSGKTSKRIVTRRPDLSKKKVTE